MLEAVGHHFFDTFFEKCNQHLKLNGKMLIQTITINDQNYERAKSEVDFIKKFIFPGGCLPSISRIAASISKYTTLQWVGLDDFGSDYATTLQHWRNNFMANIEEIKTLGFDNNFIRMWLYYFAYCEAGFTEKYISDVHLLFQKRI
jgi:cyclopropane-fatty-acyl-phospholipid synthase